ncbi:hypothetical protein [Joostella sp.]|uniref:hypothetical protein n=1 Tax=Joostella sp. TaxID=2231138 RepID=UPI003A8ECA83
MPYNYNYIHEDLYPNEEFHLQRIEAFEFAFDFYIVPEINPATFVDLKIEYNPSNLKFRLIGDNSFTHRINRCMELNREFYKNFIDVNYEVKANYGGFI